jgi:hypothetical protein
VDEADPVRGIRNARGHVESHQGRSIAADWIGRGSNADRHRHDEIGDRRAVLVVVPPQSSGNPCDESVV